MAAKVDKFKPSAAGKLVEQPSLQQMRVALLDKAYVILGAGPQSPDVVLALAKKLENYVVDGKITP